MKLSIIICIYNTAIDYLAECIESITNSTLKELDGNYEICMVDDGSTVDYTDLVNKYRINYKKTENRGILAARTTGVEMASGDYAAFCDSDDTVSFHYHLPMVKKADETGADIVINDWAFHTPKMRYYCKNDDLIKYDLDVTGDDTLLSFVKQGGRQHSFYVLWNKLYKTTLLRQAFELLKHSDYPKNSSYSEDAAINFFAWRDATRVVNIHTGFYFYRIHDSQSVNVVSEQKLRTQINSMAACLTLMRENIGDNIYQERILEHIREWEELMARSHYSHAVENQYTELYTLLKECYHVNTLSRTTSKDGYAYTGNILLGTNFKQVEELLFSLWESPICQTAAYNWHDPYINRCVSNLIEAGKIEIVKKRRAVVLIPNLSSPLKLKLLHNDTLYKMGLFFFKKGSKLRKFLKRFV